MAKEIRNVAECQEYLHKLIRIADEHNKKNPEHQQFPNWQKVQEHIKQFENDVDWNKVFEDPHFSKKIRQSLMVRNEHNQIASPYHAHYVRYKKNLRQNIHDYKVYFKDIEKVNHLITDNDWKLISENKSLFNDMVESAKINEETMEKMIPYFNEEHWDKLASNQDLSAGFIEKHENEIPEGAWTSISLYQDMDESFMQKHLDNGNLDPKALSVGQKLSMDFIEKNLDKLDMDGLCQTQTLTPEFINENADKLSDEAWKAISQYQKLDVSTMEDHKDKIDWSIYSAYNELSNKVVARFQDRIDWDEATAHNKFTISTVKLDEEGNVLYDKDSPVVNMRTGQPIIDTETKEPMYLPQMEHEFQLPLLEKHMNKIGITALKENPYVQEAMKGPNGPKISVRLSQSFDYEMDIKQQIKKNFEGTRITAKDVPGKDIYQEVYQGKHLDKVAEALKASDTKHTIKSGIDYHKQAEEMLKGLNDYHLIKRQDGYIDYCKTAENILKQDAKMKRPTQTAEYYMQRSYEAVKANNVTREKDYQERIAVLDGVAVNVMLERKMPEEDIQSAMYSYSPIVKAEMRVAEKGEKYMWKQVRVEPEFDMEKNPMRSKVTKRVVDYKKYTKACIENGKRTMEKHNSMEIG